jgi:hypothetical protein
MSMTTPQREFIDALAAEVRDLTAQARYNAANIAALMAATENLKEAVEKLWNCTEDERQRGDDCRAHVDTRLTDLRRALDQTKNHAAGRSQVWSAIGKVLASAGVAAGIVFGIIAAIH